MENLVLKFDGLDTDAVMRLPGEVNLMISLDNVKLHPVLLKKYFAKGSLRLMVSQFVSGLFLDGMQYEVNNLPATISPLVARVG